MLASAGFLLLVALLSLGAPLLPLQDPMAMDPINRLKPPSLAHFFGTDSLGRDVFSRAIHGGRVSLMVGAGVALLSTLFGLICGICAGFYARVDAILMRLMDAIMSIPAILLAVALVSLNKPGALTVIIAITLVEIPRVTRVVRSVVLTVREQAYIEAAIAIGTRPLKLLVRHVLPNAVSPLIVQATFIAALAVLLEAALSFLGAGTPPEIPSWGNMMSSGRSFIRSAPWILLCPGLLLGLTGLAINVLGDELRDMLDPRMSRGMELR
ncbi:MAG TPA: ABC transporter permease [Bradyrhizobium sp.]|nr:ABC transporter permease [Bradyrhizobium sp.]